MSTPSRALVAFALAAALGVGSAGRAAAQYPPDTLPPAFALQQGAAPGMAPSPVDAPYTGPVLATDTLGNSMGAHGPSAWFGAEYLLYWTKDAPVPFAVATVGPANGTAIFGAAGTQVLFGGTSIDYTNFSGIRTHGGVWLTNNESIGLEGSFFFLPKNNAGTPALAGSSLYPVLARPFLNTAIDQQNSRVLTKPGQFLGSVTTTAGLELWGAEIGPVWRIRDNGRWTCDAITAFKFVSLTESLAINDVANTLGGGVSVLQGRAYASPSKLEVSDEYKVYNQFYGATLGLRSNLHVEAFTWSVTGKIGLGNMSSKLRTTGTSTVSGVNTAPLTSVGGLYASGGNLGDFEINQFAAIPEIGTNLNVQVTGWLAFNLGYNFMCITDVVRPGDQINGSANGSAVPTSPNWGTRLGPTGSTIPMTSSNFWAQGFNLGMTIGW